MTVGAAGTPRPEAVSPATDARSTAVVALVGRPNSGKSSLFNRLTGGHAHVGNFPGVTVDVLATEVALAGDRAATLVDLPGLYTLDASTDPDTDEGVARAFLDRASTGATEGGLLIVQVVDATQLALGLRLTRELIARNAPLLLVATQHDVLLREGRELDGGALQRALGVPVLVVSSREPATRERVFAAMATQLGRGRENLADRATATWDPDALADRVLRERGADADALRRRTRTARADAVLLHPVAGPVVFLALMATLFAAVFLIAEPVTRVLDSATRVLGAWITGRIGDGLVSSFLVDGVLGGAGTVLAFLPQIVILTIAMELLEASGYLARGAFLVDRLLRTVGLGGRAFIPLLTAHACAVPAIAATRIMRDPRERLTAILVLPLMTCSARIPTYSLLISTFFAARGAWFKSLLFVGLYFAGIASGLLASVIVNKTVTRGRRLPLVLEMPAYRAPEPRVVARVAGRAARQFVRDIGTTILVVSAVLWALLTIPRPGGAHDPAAMASTGRVARMHASVAAGVGKAMEPVTRPLGFDWRIDVGLIGSFGARELMVGTMGVIFGLENADTDTAPLAERVRDARTPDGRRAYTPLTALALMAFFVLACQCMSTVAAIRRETRSWRWPAFVLGYTYAAAYLAALLVYQGGRLLGFA